MQLTLRADDATVKQIDRILAGLRRMVTPGEAEIQPIRDAIHVAFAENFDREGSAAGTWAALAERTVLERLELGYPGDHPILIRSGEYADTWINQEAPGHGSEIEAEAATWRIAEGSDDHRAPALEFGGPRLPARPVADLSDWQVEAIAADVEKVLDRLMGLEIAP